MIKLYLGALIATCLVMTTDPLICEAVTHLDYILLNLIYLLFVHNIWWSTSFGKIQYVFIRAIFFLSIQTHLGTFYKILFFIKETLMICLESSQAFKSNVSYIIKQLCFQLPDLLLPYAIEDDFKAMKFFFFCIIVLTQITEWYFQCEKINNTFNSNHPQWQ